jgi:hypothetical protein
LTPVVLVAVTAFVFWQLQPGLLFSSSLPTGGDLGGHVGAPIQLQQLVLPRLTGWSPQWFEGFPVYEFYMPLPALAILAVHLVLPYGTAVKLVVAAVPLTLPLAAWALGRMSRLPAPIPAAMSVGILPFLFDDSYFKYGGNLLSTVIGEFSYGLAFVLALVTLGLLDVVLRTGRWRALTTLLAALTALCHPIVGVMLVVCGAMLIAAHGLELGWDALRRAVPILVLAPLVACFWILPFGWYQSEVDPLPYTLPGSWLHLLLPLPVWSELLLVALAAAGVVRAVTGRHPVSLMVVGTAVISALAVLVLPHGLIGGWEFQQTMIQLAGRLLPFWYVSAGLLAGIGGGDLALRWARRWSPAVVVAPLVALGVVLLCIAVVTGTMPGSTTTTALLPGIPTRSSWLFVSTGTSQVTSAVKTAFGGYQGSAEWPEYHALMETMARVGEEHGCGRALPQYDPYGMYGSTFEFSLFPYWTDGCIQSTYGAPTDQSLNYTFQDLAASTLSITNYETVQPGVTNPSLDVARGVDLLRTLGVRYYLADNAVLINRADAQPDLERVATSGPWVVWEVRGTSLVQPLTHEPVVAYPSSSVDPLAWIDTAAAWFLDDTTPRPSAGGPPEWPRSSDPATAAPGRALPPVTVSDVSTGTSSVSFHVDRTGVPVEVRVTYFPWWHATGADGPWRLAPDDLVVVPTGHDVVLTASPGGVEHGSALVSVLALVATGALAVWDRRRRREPSGAAAGEEGTGTPPGGDAPGTPAEVTA